MRNIKFLAWNKDSEDMIYDWCCFDHSGGQGKESDYVVMQYTGLKDKNGKEIYEGDIIQFDFKGELKTSVIKEHSLDYCYWMSLPMGRREYEVIGNIYENPELVKSNEAEKS